MLAKHIDYWQRCDNLLQGKYIEFVWVKSPGKSGLELIEILKKDNSELSFVITTAYQDLIMQKKN